MVTQMHVLQTSEGTQFPTTAEMKARAFELLRECSRNTVITYEELAAAIGLNPATDHRARRAVLRAGRRLLAEERKKLVNVIRVGYRIVKSDEHVGVSQNEQRRARRWLREALKTVTHVALDDLPANEVARVMTEQARAAVALAMTKQLSKVKEMPERSELRMPSSSKLIDMMRK